MKSKYLENAAIIHLYLCVQNVFSIYVYSSYPNREFSKKKKQPGLKRKMFHPILCSSRTIKPVTLLWISISYRVWFLTRTFIIYSLQSVNSSSICLYLSSSIKTCKWIETIHLLTCDTLMVEEPNISNNFVSANYTWTSRSNNARTYKRTGKDISFNQWNKNVGKSLQRNYFHVWIERLILPIKVYMKILFPRIPDLTSKLDFQNKLLIGLSSPQSLASLFFGQ